MNDAQHERPTTALETGYWQPFVVAATAGARTLQIVVRGQHESTLRDCFPEGEVNTDSRRALTPLPRTSELNVGMKSNILFRNTVIETERSVIG